VIIGTCAIKPRFWFDASLCPPPSIHPSTHPSHHLLNTADMSTVLAQGLRPADRHGVISLHFHTHREKGLWVFTKTRACREGLFIFVTILQRVYRALSPPVTLTQRPSICVPRGLFIRYKPSSRLIWCGGGWRGGERRKKRVHQKFL